MARNSQVRRRPQRARGTFGSTGNLLNADPAFDVVYAVRLRSAMAWRLADYDGLQRRWPGD